MKKLTTNVSLAIDFSILLNAFTFAKYFKRTVDISDNILTNFGNEDKH